MPFEKPSQLHRPSHMSTSVVKWQIGDRVCCNSFDLSNRIVGKIIAVENLIYTFCTPHGTKISGYASKFSSLTEAEEFRLTALEKEAKRWYGCLYDLILTIEERDEARRAFMEQERALFEASKKHKLITKP